MTWRNRIGLLPAMWVLLAFFIVAAIAAVSLDKPARAWVAITLIVLLVGYCVARPSGGLDLFLIAAAPNALGAILEGVVGTPTWLAIAFVPIAIWLARDEDKKIGRPPADTGARTHS